MNKKGFTLLEVMLATSMSLIVLYAVILIPNRIVMSYNGYQQEVTLNVTAHRVTSAIHTDLRQSPQIILTDEGFDIGDRSYAVNDEGILRTVHGQPQRLSDSPWELTHEEGVVSLNMLPTPSRFDRNHAAVSLTFPLDYSSFYAEEEANE